MTRAAFHHTPEMTDAIPDPDSEVPKEIRDEFFKWMKSKQSEHALRENLKILQNRKS